MAITAQQAYNSYARLKRDISDVPIPTFLEWCDWVNKMVYRYLLGLDAMRFLTSQSYTVTTSPSTQTLPTDFKNLLPFGTGVYFVSSAGDNTSRQLPITGFGSEVTGYYLTGGSIVFTGAENQTYLMRYVPNITAIDALTDYFTLDTTSTGKIIIPDEYLQFLTNAIDVLYSQWDEDIPLEQVADQRFARLLDEFARNIERQPAVYGLDDPTINFSNISGSGNYWGL